MEEGHIMDRQIVDTNYGGGPDGIRRMRTGNVAEK
jgi:hypothetical protein